MTQKNSQPERLQKIISAAGIASRRQAEELIAEGRVKVNGAIVREPGSKACLPEDVIEVDDLPISVPSPVYILLYKPYGVITSLKDPEGRKTVADILIQAGEKTRTYPVGRLDFDTEGLLLLTNDGNLTNLLAHPRHEVDKEYEVEVTGYPTTATMEKLRQGILLSDGMTAPAAVRFVGTDSVQDTTVWRLIIHEGRNRQVRRMFEAVGHTVRKLKRVRYAFLEVGELTPGEWRRLNESEVIKLIALGSRNIKE